MKFIINVPEGNTCDCEDCPFRDKSKVASFFFGEQCNGYCYF